MNKKIALSVKLRVIAAVLALVTGAGPAFSQETPTSLKEKQTDKHAIVFLVAGQSNAGGCGVFSPELHEKLGRHENRPLVPGSTAREVGLSTDAADYTHSYIWVPGKGLQRINPDTNLRPANPDAQMHGMELPVIAELEKRFPRNDIYVVKYGPGATNLYHDWNPQRMDGRYAVWLGYYRKAMDQLIDEYPEVRVVGLYWDQGESDGIDNMAGKYEKNLTNFIATLRRDTGIPELKILLRKHIFNWQNIDTVIEAQEKVVKDDRRCTLLDIDLGNREENYEAWAYSPGNGHVSSKGFVELTKRLFDGELRDATVESFDLYEADAQKGELFLEVISEHDGPLIGPKYPGTEGNKSGFETGCLLKVDGICHMFVNEMFNTPHRQLRISHWTSKEGTHWQRKGIVFDSIPGRSPFNFRSELWVQCVIYNEVQQRWNMFYVAYRSGNGNKGEIAASDYDGKIFRAVSLTKGPSGIDGPYQDVDIVMRPDVNSLPWEGQQGVDSFFPYQVG